MSAERICWGSAAVNPHHPLLWGCCKNPHGLLSCMLSTCVLQN